MNLSSARVLTLCGFVIVATPACGARQGLGSNAADASAGAGNGGSTAGHGGSPADNGGSAAGNGGSAAGNGGASGSTGAGGVGSDTGSPTRADGTCVNYAYKFHGGVCSCQQGTPDVCGDACTDRSLDNDNCGTCGHKCPATSICNAGQCGPEVFNVVPPAPGCGSLQLALADGTLYWTDRDHGTVNSLALGTANAKPTTIAAGEHTPGLVEVRGSNLFWVSAVSQEATNAAAIWSFPATGTIRRLARAGGTVADVVTETGPYGGIRGLAISEDGRTVYYSSGTNVRAVPVMGGAGIDVGHEANGGIPSALGLEGSYVGYIAAVNGKVDAVKVTGGAVASCGANPDGTLNYVDCQRLGGCTPDPLYERFIVRGGNAYWADGTEVRTGALGAAGGTSVQIIADTFSENDIVGLAAAPDAIYFAEDGDYAGNQTAMIEKAPYAPSSTAVMIARGQHHPHALVTDAKYVYWATGDCAINAVAR
jgi:hypothetical protein